MLKKYKEIFNKISKEHNMAMNYNINSKILIVDGLNNYIRMWVMMPTVNSDGVHVGGIVGYLQSLGKTIRTLNPTRVIVVFDGEGGSKRRKKIYPEYKANRGHGVRLNRVYDWASDDEESHQMLYQLSRVGTYLKNLPITLISIDNIEADDTIGYIVKELCYDDADEIYISSTDKDFYQLINDKVKVWNPVQKKIIGEKEVKERFLNIPPKNILVFRSIDGDPSDNIPGVKGLGVKTIVKYFPFITEDKKITLDDILVYAQDHLGASSSYDKVMDNSNQLKLNFKLMSLAEGNISGNSKLKIVTKYNQLPQKINYMALRKLFEEDKLWSSFTDFNSWLKLNFSYLNSFIK